MSDHPRDPDTGYSCERQQPWPLCGYAPGNYAGKCFHCREEFQGDKRAMECLECAASSAKALIEIREAELRDLRKWRDNGRQQLDSLIAAAAVFWGAGSEQHNLVRDVADALFRAASCDTHPKDGDATEIAAPLVSGAVPEGQTPTLNPPSGGSHDTR